jgi:retinol dehydrogenase-12
MVTHSETGTFTQLFPPTPTFTEKNLDDLTGKVYLITGAASGVGYELCKILYSKNATVYIGARSQKRIQGAIDSIQGEIKNSYGTLGSFVVDLADLKTIKPAVEKFTLETSRLDVLFQNAAVMTPPAGSKSVDGYDLELSTHCLGPYLLARLLQPVLQATAATPGTATGSVRVAWVASLLNIGTPKGGVSFDKFGNPVQLKAMDNYMQSKAGMFFLSHELAKGESSSGVYQVVQLNVLKET